ncbi:L-2-hydroxyglutarate oxidase [Anaerobacillus sp. MEB173]|uniref:L-2-hydroxyglutarate oxidase n=1 Tax=Anaerobacillus sp. MEB173 TaxID=3383345 RepID=UPI003F90DC60
MYDVAIIGGGIVGLSTGMAILKGNPDSRIIIIEKEKELAMHQTGHNSGVIHSGIYYKPGSLKAKLAKQGNEEIISFCKQYGIQYEQCGKVIVATKSDELPLLETLFQRGVQNQLSIEKLTSEQIKEIEPYVEGLAGIRVPSTGIVNFKQVAKMFAQIIQENGGDILCFTEVQNIEEYAWGVEVETSHGSVQAKKIINCAGLHSDRVAKMAKILTDVKVVPFRGEYFELVEEKRHLVKNLIYPVPNPEFPFLGVHFSRMIDGRVLIGPNAVLSLKREGYKKVDFEMKDFLEIIGYQGFWNVARSNIKEGMKELTRSFSKKILVKELNRFIPQINEADLIPAQAGVRAQALEYNGKMVDDFYLIKTNRAIHVCNAPSPAATASIEIGRHIAKQIIN